MGLQTTEYRSKADLKVQNKAVQTKTCMSDAEQQELSEYLKKFGIELP